LVGGRRAQGGWAVAGFGTGHAVELGVAAEAGLERGSERGGAAKAVEEREALESSPIAKTGDRDAGLGLEDAAQV
jgi:hypothetical protein